MAGTFRYSRWDGKQQGFVLDADATLSALGDDLLYHGDLNAALRRALREGLQGRDGRNLEGLRQLIERIKARREAELARWLEAREPELVSALLPGGQPVGT